jgi:hypothetical protein
LLLRQRARLFWNGLTRGPRRVWRMFGALLGLILSIGFVVSAGLNTGQLVERVSRTDPQAATDALPVLLIAVSVLTLITSLSSAFHHLFLAGDLELLMVAPVPRWSLFGLKIVEIWRDSLHVLLFQGTALFGYGLALHMPPLYYGLALGVGLVLTLASSALAATLTLGLARVRFGDAVLGASRLMAMLLFLPLGVLAIPAIGFARGRFTPLIGQDNVETMATGLRSMGPPPAWAPTTWAAHLLLGDEAAVLSAASLVAAAVVVFSGANLAYASWFQPGWERVRFSAPKLRSQARSGRSIRRTSLSLPGGAILGVLQKDWRTLLRDPRWRTGALFSLVALGLPAMALFAGDPFARGAHTMRFWFGMLPVPYLAYLFGSQQGGATLAYEGRNIAILRAAPVGMGRVVIAKVLGGLTLVIVATWAATLALGLSHGGEPLEMGMALLAGTWLAFGATLAAVAGAALTADFEGDNPQRRIGCLGTIVTSALSIFFFLTNAGLVAWWVARSSVSLPRPLVGLLPVVDLGLPVLALLAVGAIVMASRMGMRRLAGWEAS